MGDGVFVGLGCRVQAIVPRQLAIVDRLAADGYGLVGGIGQYEDMWREAYVPGPLHHGRCH